MVVEWLDFQIFGTSSKFRLLGRNRQTLGDWWWSFSLQREPETAKFYPPGEVICEIEIMVGLWQGSFKCDFFLMLTYNPEKITWNPKKKWFGKVFPTPISVSMFSFRGVTRKYTASNIKYRAPCMFGFWSNDISNWHVLSCIMFSLLLECPIGT